MRGAPPARVVAAPYPDQIPSLLQDAGPTWSCRRGFSTSEQAKALTMPGDYRFRLDDHQSGFPVAAHVTTRPRRSGRLASASGVLERTDSRRRVVAARRGFPVVTGRGFEHRGEGAEHGEQALLRRPTEQIKVDQFQ